jgi:2-keto-4-pentenoate hydratase/2-oxohepta-3-ene-1,7-dioic acid hydratase in catechol pathway
MRLASFFLPNYAPESERTIRVASGALLDVPRLGAVVDHGIVDLRRYHIGTVDNFFYRHTDSEVWQEVREAILERVEIYPLANIRLQTPIRQPTSLRDFYAFEQHVKTANENRGRDVPKEWYEIPVFYFSNHTAIYGPDDIIPYPRRSDALDYELEIACVIGKAGIDIPADKAEDYIFGYMIFNDWSARDIQRKEMAVGLGPAKGKDFASSFGPYLVTPDELADRHTGRPGVYDLEMVARVNGVERSRGNWKDLYWSFGQMIEVIGSGTVGTGCLLELTRGQGPYLQPGDVVELEIERLGVLRNTVGEKG